ncbi:hypothetical protein ABT187_49455 [Streptomyces sp. NPDC001817]|uniref:hypothetical protein n=1 Tax=Streptomyces sp. NPDC001817 TaxID=3154398 RepID=UPI0033327922
MTADALYGQDWHFRRMLEEAGLGYVVAVPLAGCWRIDQLIGDAPDEAWERLSCGDGARSCPLSWCSRSRPVASASESSGRCRCGPSRDHPLIPAQ